MNRARVCLVWCGVFYAALLLFGAHSIAFAHEPAKSPPAAGATVAKPKDSPPLVVYFEPVHSLSYRSKDHSVDSLFIAALFQQAAEWAVQEELGGKVIDESLSIGKVDMKGLPRMRILDSGNPPRKLVCQFPDRAVEFFQEPLFEQWEKRVPGKKESINNYPDKIDFVMLITELEKRSRTEIANELAKTLAINRPEKRFSNAPVPESIADSLKTMNFVVQWNNARQLHSEMRKQGESPLLLAALSRTYMHLGLLTENNWHWIDKIFKARGVLYAQRLRAFYPDNPEGPITRGYAFALMGLHAEGIKDLDEALAKRADGKLPDYANWAYLLCHCDITSLELEHHKKRSPLVSLLWFVAAEQGGNTTTIRRVGSQCLDRLSDCYRFLDGLALYSNAGPDSALTTAGADAIPTKLYARIAELEELPTGVEELLVAKPQPDEEEVDKMQGEMVRRMQLAALLKSIPVDHEQFDGGLTWGLLGRLIEEFSFRQTYLHASSIRTFAPQFTDAYLTLTEPLYKDHRYRLALDVFSRNRAKFLQADKDLTKLMETESIEARAAIMQQERVSREMRRIRSANLEETANDFTAAQITHWEKHAGTIAWNAKSWLRASPRSPVAQALLIKYKWEEFGKHAKEWEEEGSQHATLLSALGLKYIQLKKFADAERCLREAIAIDSTYARYSELASLYLAQNQEDKWIGIWDEYLEKKDSSVETIRIAYEIAQHFRNKRQWDRAWPYAKTAAESMDGRTLELAAIVQEGRQEWKSAEGYWKQTIEVHGRPWVMRWYYFCRRTGQGDLKSATTVMRAIHEAEAVHPRTTAEQFFMSGWFYLMEGEYEIAAARMDRALEEVTWGNWALSAALLHHQLGNTKKRDECLKKGAVLWEEIGGDTGRGTTQFQLGEIIAKDLAAGGKVAVSDEKLFLIMQEGDASEQCWFSYYVGQYCLLQGQRDRAIKWLSRTMENTEITGTGRALAGAALVKLGVKPDAYKDALHGKKPSVLADVEANAARAAAEAKKPEEKKKPVPGVKAVP
ncbi:MAG: hypothetical protein SGJ20_05095 [Planctomycetota bacterium]|nr:hypothetical protein [Planctomycetota bacterium]